MKRLCLFFVSLLPFTFFLLPSLAVRSATSDSRLAVFDDVWETVRERYYDPTFHGLDWEMERDRFRPLAASAQTPAELYGVIRSMLSDLKDAHTRVFAPDERFDWQHPRFISVGISVREVGGAEVPLSDVAYEHEALAGLLESSDIELLFPTKKAVTIEARDDHDRWRDVLGQLHVSQVVGTAELLAGFSRFAFSDKPPLWWVDAAVD